MSTSARRWRTLTLIALAILAWIVFAAQLSEGFHTRSWVRAIVFCIPLMLPLRGLLRHDRYTYRWATLCVLPYFVVALTEAVADPTALVWSLAMLSASLLWFTALVMYLRVTRSQNLEPTP